MRFLALFQSKDHYAKVNSELQNITLDSKSGDITVEKIDQLLNEVGKIRGGEPEEQNRIEEIEKLARVLYGKSGMTIMFSMATAMGYLYLTTIILF